MVLEIVLLKYSPGHIFTGETFCTVISHTHLQCISERLHNKRSEFIMGRDIFTAGDDFLMELQILRERIFQGETLYCDTAVASVADLRPRFRSFAVDTGI